MGDGADQRPVCRLFGRFEVLGRRGVSIAFVSERSKQLFAILALERGATVSRGVLISRLWSMGSEERLRHNLSTEIWRLRSALANAGEDASRWISARPEGLSLSGEVWVDVDAFDRRVKSVPQADSFDPAAAIDAIEQIYRGDLLAEMQEEWCLVQREAYRNRFLRYLEQVLDAAKRRSDWQEALRASRRILAEDAFLEHVHRDIMSCYAMMGDRVAAMRHYEKLRHVFRQDLGVAPARDTTAFYDSLKDDGHRLLLPPPRTEAGGADMEHRLEEVREHLQRASDTIQSFIALLRRSSSIK